ncbi:uncharacterized protein G2W53_039617 [Senna tora]|uniref:Helitron helicase-like domain-containing protein n=1 Tax=Senna tora TaxID=362788 RepID=A0A834W6B0_9FABA|nr:uncharacterized protein G2W53_039617 [Senna tora]
MCDVQSNIHKGSSAPDLLTEEYWDVGLPTYECEFCDAQLWFEECVKKTRSNKNPKFSLCCMQGKVQLPSAKKPPKFLEKLISRKDTRSNHFMKEIRRYNNISSRSEGEYDASLIMQISQMLDSCNPLVMQYRTVKERCRTSNKNNLRLKLIRKRNSDARTYNLPTALEVAAIIVGDFDMERGERDIIVENRSGVLQRIDELHPLYLPMQYPLLFPYGEDGYRVETLYRNGSILDRRKQPLHKGQVPSSSVGKRIILPSSFTGGERYSRENFQDAMTICVVTGFPDLFITFTCNPRWPELDKLFKELKCRPEDRPDLLACIFKIKLNKLRRDITKDMLFGNCRAAVKNYMIHGPCGASRISSPCMVNGKCSKHFPKRLMIELHLTWMGTLNTAVGRVAHINVEFCNQSWSIKYLFKYVSKGHDKVTAAVCNKDCSEIEEGTDEIKQYYDCRYISPYDDHIDDVVGIASLMQTKFLAWFEANRKYPTSRELTYAQVPTKFVFKHDSREWCVRKAGYAVGRLYYGPPSLGELHYLRVLLTFVKGPTSYEDIRTINGVFHPTFKDAC